MTDSLKKAYAYSIGREVLYQTSGCLLLNIQRVGESSTKVCSLKLRKTMSELFLYLLENATTRVVSDEELLTQVWDKNGLKGTPHRLWEVMKDLKRKISELGVDEEFILRINSHGYLIKDGFVLPLYHIG